LGRNHLVDNFDYTNNISRNHIKISNNGSNILIEDLFSTNWTKINNIEYTQNSIGQISDTNSFQELYNILNNIWTVVGSSKEYSWQELIAIIKIIENSIIDAEVIDTSEGADLFIDENGKIVENNDFIDGEEDGGNLSLDEEDETFDPLNPMLIDPY